MDTYAAFLKRSPSRQLPISAPSWMAARMSAARPLEAPGRHDEKWLHVWATVVLPGESVEAAVSRETAALQRTAGRLAEVKARRKAS